jgi:hypothetical protein
MVPIGSMYQPICDTADSPWETMLAIHLHNANHKKILALNQTYQRPYCHI